MSKHCPKCYQSFSDAFDECAYCGAELCDGDYVVYDDVAKTTEANRSIYLKTAYYDLELKPQSVELKCSRCKKVFEIDENLLEIFEEIKSEYLIIRDGKQVECECGNVHPFQKMVFEGALQNNSTKSRVSNSTSNRAAATEQNVPRCLTCQSTNIKKISNLSKAGSVAMWGLFSQKVKKQWHCNNCGSEW